MGADQKRVDNCDNDIQVIVQVDSLACVLLLPRGAPQLQVFHAICGKLLDDVCGHLWGVDSEKVLRR